MTLFMLMMFEILHHAAHVGSAAVAAAAATFLLLGKVGDHAVGREEETRDGSGVLESRARNLGGVDDTGLEEVAVLASADVVAVRAGRLLDVGDDESRFLSGVVDELAKRSLDSAADDRRADLLVAFELKSFDGLLSAEVSDAAAGNDTLFDRSAGGVESIVDAILLLLHRSLGRSADLDERDTAGELGETLLELLAVVVGGSLLDLLLDELNAGLDISALAETLDDRRIVLVDDDLLGAAEHINRDGLELDADVFADELAAREDGDILEDGLAAVTEAGSLDGADLERAAELVDDESRESFALDILGDDHERTAGLGDALEERKHILEVGDLLLEKENEGILKLALHALGSGDEVRREVTLVELHALDDIESGLERLGLFDGDRAVLADLVHRVGDHLADLGVAVGGDRGNLGDLIGRLDLLGELGDRLGNGGGSLVDTVLKGHSVRAGGEVLKTFTVNSLGEERRRRRAVAGYVVRLGGDFLNHLSAHVLEGIGKLDFLSYGNTVLGDLGRAELLVDDDVTAGRTESRSYGTRELLDTGENLLTSFCIKLNLLSHFFLPFISSRSTSCARYSRLRF